MNNIFAQATQTKLRFPSKIGSLSTEDLWDLPLTSPSRTSLDSISTEVLASVPTKSLVKKSTSDETYDLRVGVLSYIIQAKQQSAKDAVKAKETTIRKDQIIEALHEKQIDEIKATSAKDLKRELKQLNK